MALVILSAGTLTQSKVRTVSARLFAVVCGVAVLAALGGGFALGQRFAPAPVEAVETAPIAVAVDPSQPEGQLLIDRFGELSGRMVQLEVEAAGLVERIDVLREFGTGATEEVPSSGRAPRTPPAQSTGGPLLDPLSPEAPVAKGLLLDLGLAKMGAAAPSSDGTLDGELDRIENNIDRLSEAFSRMDRIATEYKVAQMSFPGRLPVLEGDLGSGFGNRVDPFRKRLAFHSGVDFAAPRGTPILASAGGRVIHAGHRPDYGYTVEIDHGAGVVSRYAHASKLFVEVGQVVMPHQKIAAIGSSGRSTGPHLHFEIMKDGMLVDPAFYLAQF